jgi:tetratricopeptide (TPR) repeat protein
MFHPTDIQIVHKKVIISAILVRSGQVDEALRLIDEIEAKYQEGNESLETLNIKTVAYRARNELKKAVEMLQRGLETYPNSIDLAHNLSVTATDLGNFELAEEAALKALKINPKNIETYKNLGRVYVSNRSLSKARETFNTLEKLTNSKNIDVLVGYGAIELMQSNPNSASDYFMAALKIDDSLSAAWANLGICYKYKGDYQNAKICLENAAKKDPNQVEHQWNLALVNLALGNFADGWKQYEIRFNPKRITPDAVKLPSTQYPALTPGDSIVGKTVILVQEQGFGDTFQFFRFSKNLKDEGAKKIIAVVSKELAQVIRTIPWIDEVRTEVKNLAQPPDYWIFAMSLPLRYQLDSVEKIPALKQYISIDQTKKEDFSKLFNPNGNKLRVGLVWAGRETHSNDSNRSLNIKLLEPLLEMHSQVEFISLQKGPREVDIAHDGRIKSCGSILNNFADTAALMSNLDLLISIDSSPVHLAGALGMPVWTLIPSIYDFRWLIDREDSPWYPSMTLFRQQPNEPWEAVVGKIKNQLQQKIQCKQERWNAESLVVHPSLADDNIAGVQLFLKSAFQYHIEGRLDLAELMYKKLLTYQPDSLDGVRNIAALYRRQGKMQLAKDTYEDGERRGISDPIFYVNYANLLVDLKKYPEAIEKAQKALAINPNHDPAKAVINQCKAFIHQ